MITGKNAVRCLSTLLWIMLIAASATMSEAFAAGKNPTPPPTPSLSISLDKYEADALLVKYKASVSDLDAETSTKRYHGARSVTSLKRHNKLPKNPGEQWRHVKFHAGEDLQKAMKRLQQDPNVEYVEPNYTVSVDAIPNDPRFLELWGMNNTGQTGGTANADINAPEAWDMHTGSGDVIVP